MIRFLNRLVGPLRAPDRPRIPSWAVCTFGATRSKKSGPREGPLKGECGFGELPVRAVLRPSSGTTSPAFESQFDDSATSVNPFLGDDLTSFTGVGEPWRKVGEGEVVVNGLLDVHARS